jgi:hypothetical protein
MLFGAFNPTAGKFTTRDLSRKQIAGIRPPSHPFRKATQREGMNRGKNEDVFPERDTSPDYRSQAESPPCCPLPFFSHSVSEALFC